MGATIIQTVVLKYTGAAPGADANAYTLFSTVDAGCPKQWAPQWGLNAYHYDIKHSQSLTVRGYHSKDRGVTWVQFYSSGVLTAPTLTSTAVVLIEGFEDFKFEVLNAGAAQATFVVNQDVCSYP